MVTEEQCAQAVRDLFTLIQATGYPVALAGTHEHNLELWVGDTRVLCIDDRGYGTELA